MKRLTEKFKSFDNFGEAVSVNYKGDTSYKTYTGACFSLLLLTFIFGFGIFTFLDVLDY